MRISAEAFREKLTVLLNRIKADKSAKEKLASLSEKELDKIQDNAMTLVPYYSKNKSKTGGARRGGARTKQKRKNRTRKKRGGLWDEIALLILAGGVYFFASKFFRPGPDEDEDDRKRYHRRNRRIAQRRRVLRANEWDEGSRSSDYGFDPGPGPHSHAMTQFEENRAAVRQRARRHWRQARDYTSSIGEVIPGGAVYEEARSRWAD